MSFSGPLNRPLNSAIEIFPNPLECLVDTAEARKHNFAVPIHSLPAEIFLDVLFISINFTTQPLIPQLHLLAQVCQYWFHSIITNPRFWCVIDFENHDLVPVVLRRNPSGPLAVICDCGEYYDLPDDFLEVARTQAYRWDQLQVSGVFEERHMYHFRSPTPALKVLRITDHDLGAQIFPLSDTSTLRHIHIQGLGVPWDSPSLHGLKSISIAFQTFHSPSLRQIVTMLLASPGLEWLKLEHISDATSHDDEVPEQPISLPALRGLELLREASPLITRHLLKTINGPQCGVLNVSISFELLQHPGPTFTKFVSTSMRIAKILRVEYVLALLDLYVDPPIKHYDIGAEWPEKGRDTDVSISIIDVPNAPGSLDLAANALALFAGPTEVELVFTLDHNASDPKLMFEDHHNIWQLATSIVFNQHNDFTTLLQFLANPVITDGRTQWPCPRLAQLTFGLGSGELLKEVADAVKEILTNRSWAAAAGTGEGNAADTLSDIPVPLEMITGYSEFLDLIRGTEEAEGILFFEHGRIIQQEQ